MPKNYDFAGWATRVDMKCTDGRTIKTGAFKDDDKRKVPLVWNHSHDDPTNVLGHALLEYRPEGVRTYGYFNDTEKGRNAKEQVAHEDIVGLSIYANNLKQIGQDVVHGVIREVSLVLAGANPGAYIDTVLVHSDDYELDEAIIYSGEGLELSHSAKKSVRPIDAVDSGRVVEDEDEDDDEENKEEPKMPENTKKKKPVKDDEKTVGDVFNTLDEEQKTAVYAIIGQVLEDAKNKKDDDNDDDEEGNRVKHNVFDTDTRSQGSYLTAADMQVLMRDAKSFGSLREAIKHHSEDGGVLAHAIDTTGMTVATGNQTYGFNDASMLFPDYRSLAAQPEWVSRDMTWVQKLMSAVHHTPFSRVKSVFADITETEARARGYIKGRMKKDEVFTLLKRTTDPQTVYKKQKIDRDDLQDITDFDVLAWIRAELRTMLDEEIAVAILLGDGRSSSSDDKISEVHIRPIATDAPLFNTVVPVTVPSNADYNIRAKAIINAAIRSRKNYKGSGRPSFWTTEDTLSDMLLLEDGIGHKLYKTMEELATALRVKEIITVEPMENRTISYSGSDAPLIGIIANLADYNVGTDKGGEVTMLDDFDIDYNQQKYLVETRISGALTKPFSALTLVLNETSASTSTSTDPDNP